MTISTASSSRLLAGPPLAAGTESWRDHYARLGPLPTGASARNAIPTLEASGLLGRGGAGFPVGRKWRTVAERSAGDAIVLVNGAEGEPRSAKDRALMTLRPHLVLDGAQLAAEAVGAEEVILYVGSAHVAARSSLEAAVAARGRSLTVPVSIFVAPDRYIAGEESAAVHFVNDGDARPTTTPPRPFESGVAGRPTLVQNVESIAYAALIARAGSDWYRAAGRAVTRGTGLVTVSGVSQPGVREIELGNDRRRGGDDGRHGTGCRPGRAPRRLLRLVGDDRRGLEPPARPDRHAQRRAVVRRRDRLVPRPPARAGWRPPPGSWTTWPVPAPPSAGRACSGCARSPTRRTASPAERARRDDLARVERWTGQLAGRGACRHPDGAVGLLASALRVFGSEFVRHAAGRGCSMTAGRGAAA